ncbi:MAG: cell division protein FtsW [Ruminococcaceae bacterium]|nr:cell division protein FtsW [Oscillospiraceae bacterium]
MRETLQEAKSFFRKGDIVLLILCLATSAFGCLVVASATSAAKFGGSTRYIGIQLVATLVGVFAYILMSSIDVDALSERRRGLTVFNIFLLLLLIPLGTDNNTGNKSWIPLPVLPINVQPAEICKIFFIVVLASVMASHQNRISGARSVLHILFHFGLIAGLNFVISHDLGVTLIFAAIFLGLFIAGGIRLSWFFGGLGALAAVFPVLWVKFLSDEQKNRILVLIVPEVIDPTGLDERWHTTQSLNSLTGGGMLGQGLFNGNRTQGGQLFAQHTDYIFSSIGEELGYVGCLLVIVLMLAIIGRCIWVGTQSKDYMRRMVCFGAAFALMFQVMINIGMCLGVMPVIGLTLPLISYGGSSIIATYLMLGLVSGVHARPAPRIHERYIRPPL